MTDDKVSTLDAYLPTKTMTELAPDGRLRRKNLERHAPCIVSVDGVPILVILKWESTLELHTKLHEDNAARAALESAARDMDRWLYGQDAHATRAGNWLRARAKEIK